jgi:hypothetical protein
MKTGDRVIWLRSPKCSCIKGWRVEQIPGEIVRIHRQLIRIRVWHRGEERFVNVNPDNVLHGEEYTDVPWNPCNPWLERNGEYS